MAISNAAGLRVDQRLTIGDRKWEMVVRLEGVTNEPRFPRGSNRRVLAFTVVAVLRFVRQASSFLGIAVAYRARASESSLTRIRVTLPRTWLPNGRPLAAVILDGWKEVSPEGSCTNRREASTSERAKCCNFE